MSSHSKPLPLITHMTKPFWDAMKKHEFIIQKCKECSAYMFPPKPWCTECGSRELEWTKTSGRGTVYTYTVIQQDLDRGFKDDVPYVLALIELDEGPRLYTIMDNKAEEMKIGAKASVVYEDATPDIAIYKFRLE